MNLLLAFIYARVFQLLLFCVLFQVCCCCCYALSDKQIKHLQNQRLYAMSTLCNLNNCHTQKYKFHDNERWFYLLFLSRLCYCTQYKMCNGYNENMEYIFSYPKFFCASYRPHLHSDKYVKSCEQRKNE